MNCYICSILYLIATLFVVYCEDPDNCNDTFTYHDESVSPNLYKFVTDKSVYKKVFAGTEYTRYEQLISVYWVNGTKPGQQFILCIPEKAGRTRTKMIINRVTDPNYDGEYRREDKFIHLADLKEDDFHKVINDPKILRFAFVRDPYTRAISMYNMFFGSQENHSAYRKQVKRQMGYKVDQHVTFEQFLTRLRYYQDFEISTKHEKNRHFMPQTASCFIPQGMRYNYVLKQEKQDKWWPCFIRKAQIYEEMMHGWQSQEECLLSTERDPCNGPYIQDGVLQHASDLVVKHNTNSSLLFDQFYENKTNLNLVTQIYLEDFINFGFEIKY